jgi:hypothetical protein
MPQRTRRRLNPTRLPRLACVCARIPTSHFGHPVGYIPTASDRPLLIHRVVSHTMSLHRLRLTHTRPYSTGCRRCRRWCALASGRRASQLPHGRGRKARQRGTRGLNLVKYGTTCQALDRRGNDLLVDWRRGAGSVSIYFSPGGEEGTKHASRHPPPSGGPSLTGRRDTSSFHRPRPSLPPPCALT